FVLYQVMESLVDVNEKEKEKKKIHLYQLAALILQKEEDIKKLHDNIAKIDKRDGENICKIKNKIIDLEKQLREHKNKENHLLENLTDVKEKTENELQQSLEELSKINNKIDGLKQTLNKYKEEEVAVSVQFADLNKEKEKTEKSRLNGLTTKIVRAEVTFDELNHGITKKINIMKLKLPN
ncbi:unnamed protein product, partial [Rotaria sp. Silwood1]